MIVQFKVKCRPFLI